MTLGGDGRGQSTVIGATLVFALIVLALGTTQAFVVPEQNAAVAQQHWENARGDMTELRSVMDRIADRQSSASVAVTLGQRLPNRPFLVEGTPPSGTLETRPVAITIRGRNYTAPVGKSGNETINSTELNGSSPTRELRYRQSGGDWQTLSSVVGPVSTFVKQDNRTSQAVVESGERIDVLILKGNLSVAGLRTEQVELDGIDRTCVTIQGDSGPPEIEVNRTGSPDRAIDWNGSEFKRVCLLVVSVNDEEVDPSRWTPDTGGGGGTGGPGGPSIIDDFKDNNLDEYKRDTNKFNATGNVLQSGDGFIYSDDGDGLNTYPSQGDTILYNVTYDLEDPSSVAFGLSNGGNKGYEVEADPSGDLRIIKRKPSGNVELESEDVSSSLSTSQAYTFRVDWRSDGTIVVKVYEQSDGTDGTPEASVSGIDNTYTTGGIGFGAESGGIDYENIRKA